MALITTVVVAFHEAAHSIGLLALRRRIAVVWVEDDLSGRCECEEKRAPMPEWHSLMAAFECAADFIGVIAGAWCKDQQACDDDADIARWGGSGDLENVQRKAAVLTNDDPWKVANLRRRSWDVASRLVVNYWRSITEIATDLHCKRQLFHDDVCAAVRRAGDHRLLREPARAPRRVASPWTVAQRGGKLVEIDERGITRRIITRPARHGLF
jgi:hypothetical protein